MFVRHAPAALWVIVTLLAAVQPLSGQATTPAAEESRIPGWVFTPSLAVGGAWDDNVVLVRRDNDPPQDYASPIRPSATLDFTGKRTFFAASYNGSFTYYRSLDELTSMDHGFRASAQYRLTRRISIFADEDFSRATSTDALRLAGVPFYRIGSRTNTAGGGVEAVLDKHTSLRARYALRSVSFDFDDVAQRELRGGNAHDVQLSGTRTLSSRLSLGGEYNLQQGTIDQATPRDLPATEFSIQSGALTAVYRLTPMLTITGAAGLAHLGGGVAQESRVGPTFRAGAGWRAEHYLASVSYQRSFVPSFGFGGTFENEEWNANVRVPFAKNRAYADSGVSWSRNEPLLELQPDLRSLWFSGKVGFRANQWLSVEGYYSRAEQDARALGLLSRNQVGFQVVTSKPLKLR